VSNENKHQEKTAISKFSGLDGFDTLLNIRGVKCLSVKVECWDITCGPLLNVTKPTTAEVTTFRAFLFGILKEPKEVPVSTSRHVNTLTKLTEDKEEAYSEDQDKGRRNQGQGHSTYWERMNNEQFNLGESRLMMHCGQMEGRGSFVP